MEQYETSEAIKIRAEQEDPIVMYLIVNETLNMSSGKLCAQTGHAVQMLFQDLHNITAYPEFRESYSKEELQKLELYELWLKTSFRKVTLKADAKEWVKIKEAMKNDMVLVVDSGLTEIPAGSETVIGLFPMKKSERPKIIKKLQVLK